MYTGQGGRDQNSGAQIADQDMSRGNLGLAISQLNGLPVRVTRGAAHESPYSPETGYRYNGLYYVENHWHEKGVSGFRVYRFRLVRIPRDEIRIPEQPDDPNAPPNDKERETRRRSTTKLRIVRDSQEALKVKRVHDFQCQVCGIRLETPNGPYSEAAHIRPLGEPHNGPDRSDNILCLCPNHHVLLDYGAISVDDDFNVIGGEAELRLHPRHRLEMTHLTYHREHIHGEK